MKKILLLIMVLLPSIVFAGWDDSPYNYKNSPYNYENSPYNYKNSPYNYNNSPYNPNSQNQIYDERGNNKGYITPKSDGGYNIYDYKGHRKGYVD